MQPNEPQDFQRPGQGLPVQPLQPVQPIQPVSQPLNPVATPISSNPPVSTPDTAQLDVIDPANSDVVDDQNQPDDEEFEGSVSWTANEYIHQEKGTQWLSIFVVVCLGFVGLSIWTQAWSFTALIVVIAFVVIVYMRRPPRELTYSLTEDGLLVDSKLYEYEGFKAFGIIQDGEEYSVMLIPTQRFQPSVTAYFPEEVGDDIVDVLGERLPIKDLKLDAVDRLVRMLRL